MPVQGYFSQSRTDAAPDGVEWPRHGVSASASVDACHIITELLDVCRWDAQRGAVIIPEWARFRVAGHLETIRENGYLCELVDEN